MNGIRAGRWNNTFAPHYPQKFRNFLGNLKSSFARSWSLVERPLEQQFFSVVGCSSYAKFLIRSFLARKKCSILIRNSISVEKEKRNYTENGERNQMKPNKNV